MQYLIRAAKEQFEKFEELESFDARAFGNNPQLAKWQVEECCLHYIPPDAIEFHYDPPEEYWKIVVKGYRAYWKAILELLQLGQSPTVDHVEAKLSQDQWGVREWAGVAIEYALDALFHLAYQEYQMDLYVPVDGEVAEEAEELQGVLETPLDEYFDVIWFMCVPRGGGLKSFCHHRGPYDWSDVCQTLPPAEDADDDSEMGDEEGEVGDEEVEDDNDGEAPEANAE
eukprot:Sro633_g178830.1 n/a (227) ;mRNA; r:25819-26499